MGKKKPEAPRLPKEQLEKVESQVRELNPGLLKKLDPKQKEELLTTISYYSFSGPLPHPSLLEEYGNHIENAPERLMRMAEKEQNHTHAMERIAIPAAYRETRIGQVFALL